MTSPMEGSWKAHDDGVSDGLTEIVVEYDSEGAAEGELESDRELEKEVDTLGVLEARISNRTASAIVCPVGFCGVEMMMLASLDCRNSKLPITSHCRPVNRISTTVSNTPAA